MKKIILISAICAICTQAQSQSWNLSGNTGTDPVSNFIGTTDNKAFKIRTNNKVRVTVSTGGNVGVGIITPAVKLHVKGDNEAMRIEGANPFLQFYNGSTAVGYNWVFGNDYIMGTNATNASGTVQFWTGGSNRMIISPTGNVSIGNFLASYKLDVCGTIRAAEVRVSTGWCDYVFADEYMLPSLNEVEKFVKENNHLPGIAPASEVETEGGLKVGEMMAGMMKKIEELTLYAIAQEKKITKLSGVIEKMNKK